MVACLLALLVVETNMDRADFYAALNRVKEDMSPADVKMILGEPDDIWPHHELGGLVADSMWAYGSDGHLGFPTLGHVYFKDERVWLFRPNEEPFRQLVPEERLRGMMRLLGERHPTSRTHDPLWVIRCVNTLIAMGKKKAIFCLEQFMRVGSPRWDGESELFWVMRALFEVPDTPGYMRVPMIGAITPRPPEDMTVSPRFPIVVVDDVPFSVLIGVMLGGSPERPLRALRGYYSKWPMRQQPLVPPDDPFSSMTKLRLSPQWPWSSQEEKRSNSRFAVSYDEYGGFLLDQVLMLVRHTYQPFDRRLGKYVNGLNNAKYHGEFLKLGARWNPELQDYVRSDGIVLADKKNPPAAFWRPTVFNSIEVKLTFQRIAETDKVELSYHMTDFPAEGVVPEVVRVFDAETKQLIGWLPVDSQGWRRGWTSGQATDAGAIDRYLAGEPMNTTSMGRATGTDFELNLGRAIWVEAATRDHVEKSGLLRP